MGGGPARVSGRSGHRSYTKGPVLTTTTLVLMAPVTTFMTSPLLDWFYAAKAPLVEDRVAQVA
jgi:hypothetical protein